MEPLKAVFQSSEVELRDEAYKLISHLHAQTMLICGEGLENFGNHSDEIKSNYLWSMCDLAERSLMLISRMQTSSGNAKNE
ncbi:MAG: hypothetical protein V4695_09785 [Pseudomonadota bacterium]